MRMMKFGLQKVMNGRTVQLAPKVADAELGTTDWIEIRARVRERDKGMCRAKGCTRTGFYVDHIVERRDGGALYDMANLELLCSPCHGKKTARERAKRAGIR